MHALQAVDLTYRQTFVPVTRDDVLAYQTEFPRSSIEAARNKMSSQKRGQDHVAKKRRAIEQRKSEGPHEPKVADDGPRKRLFHTTVDLVKKGFQKLVGSLPGMKRISKKQKVSYQDIKHTKVCKGRSSRGL
jgi:hypothetical protein